MKDAKEAGRARALSSGSERLAGLLRAQPAALPLALHKLVHDVDVKSVHAHIFFIVLLIII